MTILTWKTASKTRLKMALFNSLIASHLRNSNRHNLETNWPLAEVLQLPKAPSLPQWTPPTRATSMQRSQLQKWAMQDIARAFKGSQAGRKSRLGSPKEAYCKILSTKERVPQVTKDRLRRRTVSGSELSKGWLHRRRQEKGHYQPCPGRP